MIGVVIIAIQVRLTIRSAYFRLSMSFLGICLLFFDCGALAQSSLPYNWRPVRHQFLKGDSSIFLQDTVPNRKRSVAVTSTALGGYALAYTGLSLAWYKDYPRTKFHFFNDNHEWAQIDKAGHFLGGYSGGRGMIALFKWSGLSQKKAAIYGGLIGGMALVPIEVLDGFADK